MIFFRLTINYFQNIPKTSEKLLVYQNSQTCIRCGSGFVNEKCTKCTEFGQVSSATKFYRLPLKYPFESKNFIDNKMKLTPLQQEASDFIIRGLTQEKDILIWAVCGAGKTEITFNAIEFYILQKMYVAFVIPRRDLLLEIAKRLEEYFTKIIIGVISSDCKRNKNAQIYVLTPNQLLRFKECFGLIICDEVDAYPFEQDPRFKYAIKTAKVNEQAKVIYLTSTPSELLLNQKLNMFIINRRWHGNMLPVPELLYLNRYCFKLHYLPIKLKEIFKRNRKIMIFVGQIKFGKLVNKILNSYHYNCEFTYANDTMRIKKIESFRNEEFKILITTTILERGVTFNGIDVVVLDADYFTYNTASLIQIAGRVNRNKNDQSGKVFFCFHTPNSSIKTALEIIEKMNQK